MSKIKDIMKRICGLVPLSNRIMFENLPDLTDSSKAIFDVIVRRVPHTWVQMS